MGCAVVLYMHCCHLSELLPDVQKALLDDQVQGKGRTEEWDLFISQFPECWLSWEIVK